MTHYQPVLSKPDFVRRYSNGEFGNKSPTWESPYELSLSIERGELDGSLVHLRNRKTAGGQTYYNLEPRRALKLWNSKGGVTNGLALNSFGIDNWYCGKMAPHEHNLIQGEVYLGSRGLELTYSTVVGVPMRDALTRETLTTVGIRAIGVLRVNLNPVSYDWLQLLLTRYPGHVIEISVFRVNWGNLPGYNTVYWEVRNY